MDGAVIAHGGRERHLHAEAEQQFTEAARTALPVSLAVLLLSSHIAAGRIDGMWMRISAHGTWVLVSSW